MATTQPKTYLALGDSYTIGEMVVPEQTWPAQLVAKANRKGHEMEAPHIIAATGWTTSELLAAMEKENPDRKFDFVSLLIGVNNQYRGCRFARYEREFVMLVRKGLACCRGRINHFFVVSVPDYSVTPFGRQRDPQRTAAELDRYNDFAQKHCEQSGIAFFNITSISRRAFTQPDLTAKDELHPSEKQYALWVEKIAPWLEERLEKTGN